MVPGTLGWQRKFILALGNWHIISIADNMYFAQFPVWPLMMFAVLV
jgi:hypothetical protein